MTTIRVLDFETTGFPPNAGVCEAGWTDVILGDDGAVTITETVSKLCYPGLPIQPKAESVHGISDAMVKEQPPSSLVFKEIAVGADVFCAHNAEFEQNFFTGGDRPWICTYKVALALRPGLSSYKNGNLPGLLGVSLDADRCAPLHRAGPDTYVTARVLESFLLSGATVPEMTGISREPKRVDRMPFGKYRGTRIEHLPDSYIGWACQNMVIPDVRAAIIAERDRRNGGAA